MKPGRHLNSVSGFHLGQPHIFFKLRQEAWESLDVPMTATLLLEILLASRHFQFRPIIFSIAVHWGLETGR